MVNYLLVDIIIMVKLEIITMKINIHLLKLILMNQLFQFMQVVIMQLQLQIIIQFMFGEIMNMDNYQQLQMMN